MTDLTGPGPGRRRRPARHVDRAGAARAGASRCCCATSTPRTSAPPPGSAPATRDAGRRRRRSWWWSRCRPTTSARGRRAALTSTDAVVTDVGSVKGAPLAAVRRPAPDDARAATSAATRWPAASGPGRWPRRGAVRRPARGRSPRTTTPTPAAVDAGRRAGRGCAAPTPVRLTPGRARPGGRADLAPAAPARRRWSPAGSPTPRRAPRAVGQGVRDVTRIAAGDPVLWQQIVTANAAGRDAGCCATCATDARRAASTRVADGDRAPARPRSSTAGVAGTAAIPGKHGGPARPTALGVRRRCPTTRASWPGCSPTPGRDRGQHRGRAHRPRPGPRRTAWSSCSSTADQRRAPAGLARGPGLDDPPVGAAPARGNAAIASRQCSSRGAWSWRWTDPPGSGKSSTSRGVAAPAGPALPRHRRDVPRDDLVDARARRRRRRPAPRSPRGPTSRCSSPAPTRRRRRSPSTAPTSPAAIRDAGGHRRGQRGQRRARRSARRLLRAAARDHRRRRHRRRGPRHRLRGGPGRRR